MPDESQSFAGTRARLEEIVSQVRKKDTSLEKSLDLLEEGVRLANQCTELIDHADWEFAETGNGEAAEADSSDAIDGDAISAAESADGVVSSDEIADQTASDVAEAAGGVVAVETDEGPDDESDNEDA